VLTGYFVSGRHLKTRQRLQDLILEVLGTTGQGTVFLFVMRRDAGEVVVRLPSRGPDLQQFQQVLTNRLRSELPGTKVLVAPLDENLDHLRGRVAVWGRKYGDVHIARGGRENAA
jgi:hypothetical protein